MKLKNMYTYIILKISKNEKLYSDYLISYKIQIAWETIGIFLFWLTYTVIFLIFYAWLLSYDICPHPTMLRNTRRYRVNRGPLFT